MKRLAQIVGLAALLAGCSGQATQQQKVASSRYQMAQQYEEALSTHFIDEHFEAVEKERTAWRTENNNLTGMHYLKTAIDRFTAILTLADQLPCKTSEGIYFPQTSGRLWQAKIDSLSIHDASLYIRDAQIEALIEMAHDTPFSCQYSDEGRKKPKFLPWIAHYRESRLYSAVMKSHPDPQLTGWDVEHLLDRPPYKDDKELDAVIDRYIKAELRYLLALQPEDRPIDSTSITAHLLDLNENYLDGESRQQNRAALCTFMNKWWLPACKKKE